MDKSVYSTKNTQYYYTDANNVQYDLDQVWPDNMPGFWCAIRTVDKLQVSVHFHSVRTRDLRFADNPS